MKNFSAEPGQLKPLARTVEDPSCWHLGEVYIDDMIAAIGAEPGLLFWDIANEPGYSDDFVTWYEDEPEYLEEFSARPDMKELREKQEKDMEPCAAFLLLLCGRRIRSMSLVWEIFLFSRPIHPEQRHW